MASATRRALEFEDILTLVGDYGKYQSRLVLVFLIPALTIVPCITMNSLFFVHQPEYWCTVEEVAASNLSLAEQQALVAPPGEVCERYDANFSALLASGQRRVANETPTKPCDRWAYSEEYFEETAASKWDMVCDRSHLGSLFLTLGYVGSVVGTPIYGALSDRVGRKPVFFVVIIITAISAITAVLMEDLTAFLALRVITGSLIPILYQLPYIIFLELVGSSYRTRINGLVALSWSAGMCVLPLVAYLLRHWVTFGLVTSSIVFIMFLYWKILPESPRWLLSQNRCAEASAALLKVADGNGKSVDPVELRMHLEKLAERMEKEKPSEEVSDSSLDIIRNPSIRKMFLIITFSWVTNEISYFGLQINSPNLAGNPFLNFFLLAAAEIPGVFVGWYLMERLGRIWTAVGAFVLTGAACLVPVFTSEGVHAAYVGASLVGKLASAPCYMAIYLIGSELYPTSIRAASMSLSGTFVALADITVPSIVSIAEYGKYLPFLVIGLMSLASGLAVSFLPETLHQVLPQTVHDAQVFDSKQSYCSCISRRPTPDLSQLEEMPKLLTANRVD